MTRSPFLLPAILLALAVGGCAQPSPRNNPTLSAEAARYGVSPDLLVQADRAGYLPEVHGGKTFFCTRQAQTFSYVPKSQCFDPTQMAAQLQTSSEALSDIQQRMRPTTHAPGSAPVGN